MKSDAIRDVLTSTARAKAGPVRSVYYSVYSKVRKIKDAYYELPGRFFDAWHRVETSSFIQVSDLVIPEGFRAQATRYQPTKPVLFSRVIRRLPLDDPGRFAFVDLGCGKGRCLLLAARAGFGTVIGVELSEPLCRTARLNADRFGRGAFASRIEIQPGDASMARLPDAPSVYFFYNPFGEHAMAGSVASIDKHLMITGHEAYAIYVNPVHRSLIAEGGFRMIESGAIQNEDWTIWHRPAAQQKPDTPLADPDTSFPSKSNAGFTLN